MKNFKSFLKEEQHGNSVEIVFDFVSEKINFYKLTSGHDDNYDEFEPFTDEEIDQITQYFFNKIQKTFKFLEFIGVTPEPDEDIFLFSIKCALTASNVNPVNAINSFSIPNAFDCYIYVYANDNCQQNNVIIGAGVEEILWYCGSDLTRLGEVFKSIQSTTLKLIDLKNVRKGLFTIFDVVKDGNVWTADNAVLPICKIINKHLPSKNKLACQKELIQAGYKNFVK
jgi:hypothetical protein